jgi:hypothetical protein
MVIAASNGQWSVTSQELADGGYDLSVPHIIKI